MTDVRVITQNGHCSKLTMLKTDNAVPDCLATRLRQRSGVVGSVEPKQC